MLSSCMKPRSVSPVPEITFKEFISLQDSAFFTFSFIDGDGDVGLDSSYTFPPFNPPVNDSVNKIPAGEFYYNFYLDYWEKNNGVFEKITFNTPFYYRIPVITPIGQNKTLEGEIAVKLSYPYFSPLADTIKFTAYLYDRAKHKSNIIESNEIIVNQ